MSKIEKRVVIDDATERVFAYTGEPVNSPEVWPGLLEVREVHGLIGGLRYANWLYRLTGPYEVPDIRLEYEADGRALTCQLRGLNLVMTLSYLPCARCGPRLALDGDYTYWSDC